MVPNLTTRQPMRVMGVPISFDEAISHGAPDFRGYWDRFMARVDEIRPLSMAPDAYAVHYQPEQAGQSGSIMYLPALMVGEETMPPPGLVAREVPGGLYAASECDPSTVQETHEAVNVWLSCCPYARDLDRPVIERYHHPWEPKQQITLYVPVRPKSRIELFRVPTIPPSLLYVLVGVAAFITAAIAASTDDIQGWSVNVTSAGFAIAGGLCMIAAALADRRPAGKDLRPSDPPPDDADTKS